MCQPYCWLLSSWTKCARSSSLQFFCQFLNSRNWQSNTPSPDPNKKNINASGSRFTKSAFGSRFCCIKIQSGSGSGSNPDQDRDPFRIRIRVLSRSGSGSRTRFLAKNFDIFFFVDHVGLLNPDPDPKHWKKGAALLSWRIFFYKVSLTRTDQRPDPDHGLQDFDQKTPHTVFLFNPLKPFTTNMKNSSIFFSFFSLLDPDSKRVHHY